MPTPACVIPASLALGFALAANGEPTPLLFRDVAEQVGLFPHLAGLRGHGAAAGDADGDGRPDLLVTTFHNSGSPPALLLLNREGHFTPHPDPALRTSGLGSGALWVDLDNQGRLDLFVSHCAHGQEGVAAAPSRLFRNDGEGRFTDVSANSGAILPHYAGRGLAALDYDGDGRLDLALCEQYYSPEVRTGPVLLRNLGGHRFANVSAEAGLPAGLGGLGVAASDLNGDNWPDLFFTSGAGQHRLLLNDGQGRFREPPGAREIFAWHTGTADNVAAGVALGDVDGDGRADVLIGHHFKSPWTQPAPIRLYLQRGPPGGDPVFQEVTEAAGLVPLAMKAPHVEIQDLDRDGRPDLVTSIVKFREGVPHPVVFRHLGVRDGMPRFRLEGWEVNDFPTAEDRALTRSGAFFDKMLKEGKILYSAAAPLFDFDRDGRLDLFFANWWGESRSLLLRNETPGGRGLAVRVEGPPGVNRMGVGARVGVYAAGRLGDPAARLGVREITLGQGYCSGQEAIAYFGLGDVSSVDVDVVLPAGRGGWTRRGVAADTRLTLTPP
jgi:hypothetical protein